MRKGLLLCLFFAAMWFAHPAVGQTFCIEGKVVSNSGNEPLIGVNILQRNSSNGVSTDLDGNYSIVISNAEEAQLTFSYVGMEPQTFEVNRNTGILNVKMRPSQLMDEIVVVAYGVRKKGTISGSVATVKSDKLADVPTASFEQALQGQAPGLMVISQSGDPSQSAAFAIRGTNSINSGTAPLFILDGMQISSSDFNAINPSDIESVSVLKDASSTSIYGARAANGVVVITTKRGALRQQQARVSFRGQLGFSQLAQDKWDLMNTSERIAYEKEAGLTAGKDYDKLSRIDVNWFDEVFNKSSLLQNYEIQVDGAGDKARYYISGNYYDQDGVAIKSFFRRYNVHGNVEAQAKEWLKTGANILLTHEKVEQADQGSYTTVTPISAARFMLPYWNPYKADGSLASVNDGSWKGLNQNPLEWIENNPVKSDRNKMIGSVFAELIPFKGFTFRSQGGLDYSDANGEEFSYPSYRPNNGQGHARRSNTHSYNLSVTNTAEYKFNIFGCHYFTFLIGQEGVDYKSKGLVVATAGQNNDKLYDITNGTRATSWANSSTEYSYLSFFGRGEYNYDNRYYGDFSLRTDGSSRFGSEGRWASFWSLGFMWNAGNEKFLKDVSWLTNAQVALSTGTSGNSSIPDYDHLALVSNAGDYMDEAGIAPVSKGNEKLEWEKLWTTNLAFHLGFFNRISLDAEFYYKKTTNMLMSVPVSYADAGYGAHWDNVGEMKNEGIELNLNANLVRTGSFRWDVNATASYNHNEITELYSGVREYTVSTTGMKLAVGHSYGEFNLVRYAGVNPANGDQLWYDKDGNITNVYSESDRVMVGHSYIAPWQGGFGTSAAWKGLALNLQFSWVANRWIINNDRYFSENSNFSTYNLSRRILYDRWKKPGDVTSIPRFGVTPQFDTHLLENASFMRLKNVTLSYSLPASLLGKTRFISGARAYVQAHNLLTFTGFKGLDPESASNIYAAQYPMTKQFTFGLEFSF